MAITVSSRLWSTHLKPAPWNTVYLLPHVGHRLRTQSIPYSLKADAETGAFAPRLPCYHLLGSIWGGDVADFSLKHRRKALLCLMKVGYGKQPVPLSAPFGLFSPTSPYTASVHTQHNSVSGVATEGLIWSCCYTSFENE